MRLDLLSLPSFRSRGAPCGAADKVRVPQAAKRALRSKPPNRERGQGLALMLEVVLQSWRIALEGVAERASPEVLRDLEKIENTCDLSQRLSHAPNRFRVSLPGKDVVSNRTVRMDTMFLERKSVLHVVDKDKKFSAAAFLRSETTEETWETFMRIWVSVYIGFPDTIATDQGTQFQSQRRRTLLLMAGIQNNFSGVQNALMLAIKAMNDSAGPQGLVPTLSIFGVMPRIPVVPSELPEQISRMPAMHSARKEMAAVIAKDRLSTAIRANVPAAAMKNTKIVSDVFVYRENPEDKWIGPFKVLDNDDKVLRIDVKGSPMQVSLDKVKLYLQQPTDTSLESTERASQLGIGSSDAQKDPQVARSTNSDIIDELQDVLAGLRDGELEISTVNLAAAPHLNRESESHPFSDQSPKHPGFTAHDHLTEILETYDPRANSKMFDIAKDVEVKGTLKRRTWRVIPKKQLPKGANVLSGRFVLTLKNVRSNTERAKARLVAQGHRYKEKRVMVHNITTLCQSST